MFPLQSETFLKSLATSKGVICNAGFGTTSESLFLGKKLLVVPMKTQYEQKCNAAMLKTMGVTVVKSIKENNHEKISKWLESAKPLKINYPDQTDSIIERICTNHATNENLKLATMDNYLFR